MDTQENELCFDIIHTTISPFSKGEFQNVTLALQCKKDSVKGGNSTKRIATHLRPAASTFE